MNKRNITGDATFVTRPEPVFLLPGKRDKAAGKQAGKQAGKRLPEQQAGSSACQPEAAGVKFIFCTYGYSKEEINSIYKIAKFADLLQVI